jgi:tetratricopeptide (TPR) repeat protein
MGIKVAFTCFLLWGLMVGARAAPLQQDQGRSSGDTAEAHVGRGYDLVKDERYQEAAKEFQAALALKPQLVRPRYQLAVCWFALGRAQESREEFERLQKETGGDSSLTYYLARLDLRAGDFERAVNRLALIVNHPPFPDTAYYLGAAYLEKRDFNSAEKWLRVAAQADPRDSRVPDHLARAYLLAGRKAEAEKQFELSSQLRQHIDVASRQAVACSQLLETKPLAEAQPACQQLFDPNDPDKLATLGLLYGQHGYYAQAVQPLESASRLDGDSSEIQHDLGLTYFRLHRYGEARIALEKAVALRPDFFGSNALLGATLYAQGEDGASYRILAHAHALNPLDRDTADLLFKEAVILANQEEGQRKYDTALAFVQTAAGLRPDDKEVQQRLAALSQRLGRPLSTGRPEKGSPP